MLAVHMILRHVTTTLARFHIMYLIMVALLSFKCMAAESNSHSPVRGYLLQFSNLYLEQR